MKFTKMSLVAALLIGSSAFAIDNIKMSGNAKLLYSTSDAISGYTADKNALTGSNDTGSLFSKDSSAADAALNLNISADLVKNNLVAISAGAGYTVLSTLGLENNLVSNVWGGAHTATTGTNSNYANFPGYSGAKVENANWMNEAWIAATAGKTTAKIGRMKLDTPLAFTETWSAEENTFEAVVLINQDIPDTTLVGAYIGNGNGTETFGQNGQSNVQGLGLAIAPVVNREGQFTTYGTNGAYAVGVINNSFKPVTAQAWYYDLPSLATAYWLEADLNMEGVLGGAQYVSEKPSNGANTKSSSVYALMLGYEMKDVATVKVAYSSENKDSGLDGVGANTATSTGNSKLYTEAWWNYGYVTRGNTNAWNITATGKAAGVDLGAYYTSSKTKPDTSNGNATDVKMNEFTATAGKSFGPLDATLAYVYTKADDLNIKAGDTKGSAFNSIQAYLTLNF
ncbi:hypothetical protein [Sulfurimonas sp.]